MKRLLLLMAVVSTLSLAGLAACTENHEEPETEQGGDAGDDPTTKPEPEPEPEPEPGDDEPAQVSAIGLSASEFVLGVGETAELDAVIEPADAEYDTTDFVLLTGEGELSEYVSLHSCAVVDNKTLRFVIKDRRASHTQYQQLLKIVHEPTGVESALFTVSSRPVKYSMPVVRIRTQVARSTITKDTWVDGEIEIDGGGGFENLALMKTQIKGRGNSTWGYRKKPYALKLDKKQEVLGMPKHKRWCLIANWLDVTHMRNRIAYYIGQNTNLAWTPRNEYAEVYFNDEYLGLYLITEQIKVDENRVDIPELGPTDISGDALTGGYLLEFDSYYDEAYKFRSRSTNIPVNLKSPDENVPAAQMQYIQNYIDELDAAFAAMRDGKGSAASIDNLVDRRSMIDLWIVNEIMTNLELRHPKSLYFYKQRNGKLFAGPLWDFDYRTLYPSYATRWACYGLRATDSHVEAWYHNNWWNIWLGCDDEFRIDTQKRWNELYPFLQTIPSFIDDQKEWIAEAVGRNDNNWRTNDNTNGENGLSFDAAVERLRQTYMTRIQWLNSYINNW